MSKSRSVSSNKIEIESAGITSVVENIGNIHVVTGTINFNSNISSVFPTVMVKIFDIVLNVEEDITSSISLITHSPKTTISYRYEYGTSNTGVKILTPTEPLLLTSKQKLIVDINGREVYNKTFTVDSCKKYFQNQGDLGINTPTFNLETYDFSTVFNFNMPSYKADVSDEITMYCDGEPNQLGISGKFSTLNSSDIGSTPNITYSLNALSGTLNPYIYNLDSDNAIKMKLKKNDILYTDNNEFDIVNAYGSGQKLKIYMDSNFNEGQIIYSVNGSIDTKSYKLYIPVWEDVSSVKPNIDITGDMDVYIENISCSLIGSISSGEVLITIGYKVDDVDVPIGVSTITGEVSINLNNFTMNSGTLIWSVLR